MRACVGETRLSPFSPFPPFQVKAFMAMAFWSPQSAPPGRGRPAPAEESAPVASE